MTDTIERTLDTSDLDRYVGVPLAVNRLVEPVTVNDIRRWAQAMRLPNPLYYDAEYAAASRFGGIVAPQSFTIVTNAGHGFAPANVGTIPNSHQLFGGDDWWFYGPRIAPGDTMTTTQMMHGYRVSNTKFAGPTAFQRGDNHYANGRGEPVALQRSTSIRYLAANARNNASLAERDEPDWSNEDLARIFAERKAYVDSITSLGHDPRTWQSVSEGDELAVKVIGPHSHISFATEWRAYTMNLWGGSVVTERLLGESDAGNTPEMTAFVENKAWDPEFADGGYYGGARGHLFDKYAQWIGMPRSYGYGASMGAWIIDFLSTWAGEWGFVAHTASQYRGPALVGDVTYVNGTVTGKSQSSKPGQGQVSIDFVVKSHRDEVMVKGSGDVLLPLE
jgi:acyl dehydratase